MFFEAMVQSAGTQSAVCDMPSPEVDSRSRCFITSALLSLPTTVSTQQNRPALHPVATHFKLTPATMLRCPRFIAVLALLVHLTTRTAASSKEAGAASPASTSPAAAASTTSTTTTTVKRGLRANLHLPHMHAPHLQIPKGGFVFSPFRHLGGAHGNSVNAPPPSHAAGASVHDFLRPQSGTRVKNVSVAGSVLSSPAERDASQGHSSHGEPHESKTTNDKHYPHQHMKSFFQSLRSWTSFKLYCCGVRDLIFIARPLETFLLRTGTIHDRDLSRFIARAIALVAFTMIITSILGTLGLDTKPIIAGLGVSGFIGTLRIVELGPWIFNIFPQA